MFKMQGMGQALQQQRYSYMKKLRKDINQRVFSERRKRLIAHLDKVEAGTNPPFIDLISKLNTNSQQQIDRQLIRLLESNELEEEEVILFCERAEYSQLPFTILSLLIEKSINVHKIITVANNRLLRDTQAWRLCLSTGLFKKLKYCVQRGNSTQIFEEFACFFALVLEQADLELLLEYGEPSATLIEMFKSLINLPGVSVASLLYSIHSLALVNRVYSVVDGELVSRLVDILRECDNTKLGLEVLSLLDEVVKDQDSITWFYEAGGLSVVLQLIRNPNLKMVQYCINIMRRFIHLEQANFNQQTFVEYFLDNMRPQAQSLYYPFFKQLLQAYPELNIQSRLPSSFEDSMNQ